MTPFKELQRFINWKERFLKDYGRIKESYGELKEEVRTALGKEPEDRFLLALKSFYVGGMERRLKDPAVRRWAFWGARKTYETFNGFPLLSEKELPFVFWGLGKLFVPLLLHERGVKSEAFRRLSPEEQEEAVLEELDTLWETQLTLILQAVRFLELK